jgi:hypothetical protein
MWSAIEGHENCPQQISERNKLIVVTYSDLRRPSMRQSLQVHWISSAKYFPPSLRKLVGPGLCAKSNLESFPAAATDVFNTFIQSRAGCEAKVRSTAEQQLGVIVCDLEEHASPPHRQITVKVSILPKG